MDSQRRLASVPRSSTKTPYKREAATEAVRLPERARYLRSHPACRFDVLDFVSPTDHILITHWLKLAVTERHDRPR